MRVPDIGRRGLETPISMIMLISAVLLISASASVLMRDDTGSGRRDSRSLQAEMLGRSLVRYLQAKELDPADKMIEEGESFVVVWNGTAPVQGSVDEFHSSVFEVLRWAPEGLWSLAVFGQITDLPFIERTAVWTWHFGDGNAVRVFLPIQRGLPLPAGEELS